MARVVLVQSAASLLGGDDVRLAIELADGCALEVIELGAMIAHHARRGPTARLCAEVDLGCDARLVWLAQPMILAAGCRVRRETRVSMASAARALLREAFVFGRAGEEPGAIVARTRITLDGAPVLDETLDTAEASILRSAVVAGDADMIDALTLAGVRDEDAPAEAMQAHGPATLWRRLGAATGSLDDGACALSARWRRACLD
ncbi:MAG: urease accessory protein UreD [Solirubrobacteraceae bacterium]